VSYEALIREENQRHTSSQGTYYYDPNYEVDLNVAEVAASKPVSGPVGFVDSAIEVVDLEPICSSVAPLPGKLSWISRVALDRECGHFTILH